MTRTPARLAVGQTASVAVLLVLASLTLAACSAPRAAPNAGATAAPASTDLTVDGLFAELADIECEAHESGVYNQNKIWDKYATVAGKYEETGLIDSTEVEVPGAAGTIATTPLRSFLTSEVELRTHATVGEGLTTVRDEVGEAEYDLQTSLLCTVFSNDGVIPDDFLEANGITR